MCYGLWRTWSGTYFLVVLQWRTVTCFIGDVQLGEQGVIYSLFIEGTGSPQGFRSRTQSGTCFIDYTVVGNREIFDYQECYLIYTLQWRSLTCFTGYVAVENWDMFEKVMDYVYSHSIKSESCLHPLLMSEPAVSIHTYLYTVSAVSISFTSFIQLLVCSSHFPLCP